MSHSFAPSRTKKVVLQARFNMLGGETAIDLLIATVLSSHGHCESGLAVDSLNVLFIDQTNIF